MSELEEWSQNDFDDALKQKQTFIADFWAPWCGACKLMEPIVTKISKEFKDTLFAKIDVSKNGMLASKMGVISLQNFLFIKNGKVVEQIIGATTESTIKLKLKKIT